MTKNEKETAALNNAMYLLRNNLPKSIWITGGLKESVKDYLWHKAEKNILK